MACASILCSGEPSVSPLCLGGLLGLGTVMWKGRLCDPMVLPLSYRLPLHVASPRVLSVPHTPSPHPAHPVWLLWRASAAGWEGTDFTEGVAQKVLGQSPNKENKVLFILVLKSSAIVLCGKDALCLPGVGGCSAVSISARGPPWAVPIFLPQPPSGLLSPAHAAYGLMQSTLDFFLLQFCFPHHILGLLF